MQYGEAVFSLNIGRSYRANGLASTTDGFPQFCRERQNRLPHLPFGPARSLTQAHHLGAQPLFSIRGADDDYLRRRQELRAELTASIDAGERQQLPAESERAIAQLQEEAADALISAGLPYKAALNVEER